MCVLWKCVHKYRYLWRPEEGFRSPVARVYRWLWSYTRAVQTQWWSCLLNPYLFLNFVFVLCVWVFSLCVHLCPVCLVPEEAVSMFATGTSHVKYPCLSILVCRMKEKGSWVSVKNQQRCEVSRTATCMEGVPREICLGSFYSYYRVFHHRACPAQEKW